MHIHMSVWSPQDLSNNWYVFQATTPLTGHWYIMSVTMSFSRGTKRYLPYIGQGFPCGSVVKNPPANAGDACWIPRSGRSPGEGNDNPLQYSCLGNPMDRGVWWATVHEIPRVRHDLVTKPLPPPAAVRLQPLPMVSPEETQDTKT